MKRLAFFFALLFLALQVAAQSGGMPPGHQMLASPDAFADGHLAALDRQVHLSADQKVKLRPVFLEEGKQLFAVLNDSAMPAERKQAAIQKLHEETAAKVGALLTPEQLKQWTPADAPRRNPQPSSQT
jgi:hypothetical protein